jgi:CHAT domain-containing protein
MNSWLPARRLVLGLLCGTLMVARFGVAGGRLAPVVPVLAACRHAFLAVPGEGESAGCFEEVAAQGGRQRQAALRELTALRRKFPENPWIELVKARILWDRRLPERFDQAPPERAIRAAAALFARRHDVRDELRARTGLYQVLMLDRGWPELAELEVERGRQAAARSRSPDLVACADLLAASFLLDNRRDLGQAARLLAGAREPALQRSWRQADRNAYLHVLGQVHLELGENEEARRAFDQLLDRPDIDPLMRGVALVQRARAEVADLNDVPDGDGAEAARVRALDDIAAALRLLPRTTFWRADAYGYLAQLTSGPQALAAFADCAAAARAVHNTGRESYCLSRWARRLASEKPDAALVLAERAADLARHAGADVRHFAQGSAMQVRFATDPLRVLSAPEAEIDRLGVEELRALEREPGARARSFSTWTSDYYWFSGRSFRAHDEGFGDAALAAGFVVMERLRGRSLLDSLGLAPAPRPAAGEAARRSRLRAELRHLDLVLADPDTIAARAEVEADRARLAAQVELAAAQADRSPPPAVAAAPSVESAGGFVTLSQVEAALRQDEALLSFQIAPWTDWTGVFGGGSWLLVALHGAPSRVYALEEIGRGKLRALIDRLALSLEPSADGAAAAAAPPAGPAAAEAVATTLYQQLLAAGMRDLPRRIDRLVVIPDDALYRLPFAALRAGPGAPPLAARYQLSFAPSATLWWRWRRTGAGDAAGRSAVPALVLANPPLPDAASRASLGRQGIVVPEAGLAQAEVEAADVVGLLGGRELIGPEVSVGALTRRGALRGVGVLYLAAHSIVEPDRPEASGIWLGEAAGEDGLLRLEQIARLDGLKDKVVVLSSCSGAGGRLLHGEGVLSLAYAFLHAGARTVVASLSRFEDRAAQELFRRFAFHLARGRSVAAALRAAQLERLAQGAASPDWAAVVVLGDGERVPFPGGVKARHPQWRWLTAALGVLGLGLLLLSWAALGLRRARFYRPGAR